MISRKFKIFVITVCLLCFNSICLASDKSSAGATEQLPSLYYAGVIPVQWEKNGPWRELGDTRQTINEAFYQSVRSSKRFTFLDDDLVRSLWSSESGRRELTKDYEISAFVSLDVGARGDMIVLTTRLLSPKLETRLQESEVIPQSSLVKSDKEKINRQLNDLVLRMINRLPVDANITSVNGGYVTVSAGSDQGIKIGDRYEVFEAKVTSLHPVTGGWLNFDTFVTGTIEIIEVKSRSAIAKIVALATDNGIRTGQGIKIQNISSRTHFQASDTKPVVTTLPSKSEPASAAVAAQDGAKDPAEVTSKATPTVEDNRAGSTNTDATKLAQQSPAAPTAEENSAKNQDQAADPGKTTEPQAEGPTTDNFTARIMPKGSEIRTWAGMRMWAVSGSASAKAALPVWLVNAVAADIHREFSDTIDYNYGVDFGYGPTGNGSFFSYNLHSAGRWHMFMKDLLPGADDVYFGLAASFASASITGETSGGFDLTMMRFTMGVHGWARPDFIGEKIEWTGEVFVPLYYSGQFGVKGKFREIISGSSMAYRVGMYVGERPNEGWQYGAAFDFEDNTWSLKTNRKAGLSSIGLLALARRNI